MMINSYLLHENFLSISFLSNKYLVNGFINIRINFFLLQYLLRWKELKIVIRA